jgi:hypothetical protein
LKNAANTFDHIIILNTLQKLLFFRKKDYQDFLNYSSKISVNQIFDFRIEDYLDLFHNINAVQQGKQDLSNVEYLKTINPLLYKKITSLSPKEDWDFNNFEYMKVDSGFLFPLLVNENIHVRFIQPNMNVLDLINLFIYQYNFSQLDYKTVYIVAKSLSSEKVLDHLSLINSLTN